MSQSNLLEHTSVQKAGIAILVRGAWWYSHTYFVIWNQFCGSLSLHNIWDYSYASTRTYVTDGNIWYVGYGVCGIMHQVISREVSLGNGHCDTIIRSLFGTLSWAGAYRLMDFGVRDLFREWCEKCSGNSMRSVPGWLR